MTTFRFETWTEFVHAAEFGESVLDGRGPHEQDRRHSRADDDHINSWSGATWEEALDLAKNGWPEAVTMLDHRLEMVKSSIPSKREVSVVGYAAVGPGTLDMGRYIQGHPEAWTTWHPEETEDMTVGTRIVPIHFAIGASAYISKEALFEKGALICVLVDVLEREGNRVELTLDASTARNAVSIQTLVKKASEPLDLDRVVFAISHAACLRRLAFSVWETAPIETLRAAGIMPHRGYGTPSFKKIPGAINIPSTLYGDYDEVDQLQWLQKHLKPFGITLEV
ncbi:hypothetical protein LCGC14_1692230 [marine sediment metagenome]|uniref:DUF7192 domain-containing protein n=1 Tax=marine sediment metagenome TaxID=412755 RepID=A0A0F9KKI9_9ZZZZ